MVLKTTGDRKFAYFPVELQSYGFNENVSLAYEITSDGGIDFLGVYRRF